MSTWYGQLAYVVCDAQTDHGRCRNHIVPDPRTTPTTTPGCVFVHRVEAREVARALGWVEDEDGKHLCPEHQASSTAPSYPQPTVAAADDADRGPLH